jgi:hypothetical protein
MVHAFSRLKRVLNEQNMTVPGLHRRLLGQGLRVNVKSLYRLSNDRQPLQRLDLRVAGAICQVFALPLSELISFEAPQRKLRRLAAGKQKRLDALMARSNDGSLTSARGKNCGRWCAKPKRSCWTTHAGWRSSASSWRRLEGRRVARRRRPSACWLSSRIIGAWRRKLPDRLGLSRRAAIAGRTSPCG